MCDALDDLFRECGDRSADAGFEAYDALFGSPALQQDLLAFASRREELKKQFVGRPMQRFPGFTVNSGHEALSVYADSVTRRARQNFSRIPEARRLMTQASEGKDPVAEMTCKVKLADAGTTFACAMDAALNGWAEHRDWIRRSIEDETALLAQRREGTPTPPAATTALKFPRSPDAKQKCLEALARAPQGIPTHSDIAAAVSLEVQTVKEAMRKLKNAQHVVKTDGAWHITNAGRERLKLLRGE